MHPTFDNPEFLWFLVSIPLLVMTHFLSLQSARRKALRFANFRTLKRISGKKYLTKNNGVLILRAIILLLLIFSIAGAKWWYLSERADNNYVIALDTSASMLAEDFSPSRLEFVKEYAQEFITHTNPNNKVGVVTYGGTTLIEQIPHENKALSSTTISMIVNVTSGGTDLPGAIVTSTNLLLAEPDKGKVVVMFTDGGSTMGNFIDKQIERAAQYASQNNVVIHMIGIGSESAPLGYLPEIYNISSTYNEENMLLVTNITGGMFIESPTPETMRESFAQLIGEKNVAYTRIDLDYVMLMLAILLLFVEWGMSNTKFRRIA